MSETIDVLLVDDEMEYAEILHKRLVRLGHSVRTAHSGAEAFDALVRRSARVVVLDMHMPGMDGLNVLKAIKQTFAGVEVIILTGAGTMDAAMKAMKAGAFDFLHKPVDMERLHERIRAAARRMAGSVNS